ncbi:MULTISPECIES: DUF1015 family protein [unclassified Streptomyces]|uniref:DUF1015 family protein n=1 Tax=unclassified Streptomyces TaxID=2593676 RepID=UPI0035E26346
MRTSTETPRTDGLLTRGAPAGLILHPFLGIRRSGSALTRDRTPAFYVLEQRRGPELLQRGVIGALDLGAAERSVHPHERVLPHKVAVQRNILRTVGGSPEPVLLACRGATGVGAVLDRVAAGRPDTALVQPDGTRHLLWRCTDPDRIEAVAAVLARHRALLADGHHRFAAAREHRRAFGGRPGPWDRLPALVVDTAAHPLELRAIHRHLPDLAAEEAARRAAAVATVEEVTRPGPPPEPRPGEFVLVGSGGRCWSVRDVSADHARSALRGRPAAWSVLDSALLHHLFVDRVWRGLLTASRISYVHGLPRGGREVPAPGTLVLLAPPGEEEVHRLAGDGVLMPQKSTAFGPKPLPWLVTYHHTHQVRGPVAVPAALV